ISLADSDPTFSDQDISLTRKACDGKRHVLKSVRLQNWHADLENHDDRKRDPMTIREAQIAVDDAVRRLYHHYRTEDAKCGGHLDCPPDSGPRIANFIAGNWRVCAVTPHWRVTALCYTESGGPGGLPKLTNRPNTYRPKGESKRVREEVARALHGGDTSKLKSDVSGAGIRVAIIDTWPMVKGEPLGRIEDFLTRYPKVRDENPTLMAVYESLRKALKDDPTRIMDYVSGTTVPPPLRRYNWFRNRYEPYYDISDHGLFIAGIINEIAPNAELAVYRVLNE